MKNEVLKKKHLMRVEIYIFQLHNNVSYFEYN